MFKRLKNIEDNLVEVDNNDNKVGIFRIIKDIKGRSIKIDNDDEAVREIRERIKGLMDDGIKVNNFDEMKKGDDRPLPIGVNKKVVGLMKDELGGGIITEFAALRPKAYSYKTNDNIELKKAKGTKQCVVKKMLRFNDYKNCLFANGKVLRSQQRFKSENHAVYTENINKIALSRDDDKRIVAKDGIASYPYGYVISMIDNN